MLRPNVIITVKFIKTGRHHDLEVPLDISAGELCLALFKIYRPELQGNVQHHYLRAERPIALLRGERTLRDYGIRDGSIINMID